MVVLKANKSVDMSPTSTSYIPPSGLAAVQSTSPTQIDALDPLGRLQVYLGEFNLADLQKLKFDTSTFTGYKQYAGNTTATTLQYELSGASINGAVAFDFIQVKKDPYGLVQDIFKGDDLITGSDEADILAAFKGADQVKGLAGADSLLGGEGNDFLNGNQGLDTVEGGKGDDTVRGGKGADLLSGGQGNDQLFGDLGNDQLFGGEDNDRITGNGGNDTSTGGSGADRFVLSKDFDVILDFKAAEGDKIEVLASTPYTLGSTGSGGTGDLQIIRAEGTTTLLGVTLASFDANTSIILI